MSKVQQWLESQEEYNTEEKRGKIKELDISKKDLEGALDLSDFVNLEKLNCTCNQLSAINLSNCSRLKDFDCSFNKLTNLDLVGLNQLEKIFCNDNYLISIDYYSLNFNLTYLNISNNNLIEQDLSIFSKLINLEFLRIGGSNERYFLKNIYNKFCGTLESLKNLTKLRFLDISNTDINCGWEYLPNSLEKICFSSEERPESKVKEITEQLKWIGKLSSQQLREWMEVSPYPADYEFALYLKQKGYHSWLTLNYEKLKEAYNKDQGWLNKNYPAEERWGVSEIYLNEKYLEGELDLEDFRFLRVVYISRHIDETRLEIKNKTEGANIIKLVAAQEWLDSIYPQDGVCTKKTFPWDNKGKTRSEITKLSISEKNLEGELDLSDFVNLTSLNCRGNKLTNLNISKSTNLTRLLCYDNRLTNLDTSNNRKLVQLQCCNNQLKELNVINNNELTTLICYDNKLTVLNFADCEKLKILNCCNNYLIKLDYLSLLTKQLTHLDIRNNNIFEQDLSVFSRMINLKRLYIGNNDETKIQQNIYNRFIGSLEPLIELTKLERLDINNTDIDDGLDHLSDTVQELKCSAEVRLGSKVEKITENKEEKVAKLIQWEATNSQQNQQFKREENSLIIAVVIAEINKLQGKLEVQEEIKYRRRNSANLVAAWENQPSKISLINIVSQLKKEPMQIKENQKIFEKIKELLVVKEIFLNMRQATIKGLQNCYNEKHMKIGTANKETKIIEEVASFVNCLAPEFLKKTVEVIKGSFQKKSSDKQVNEFKELLINDKENLFLLNKDIIDKIYRPLSKSGLKVRLENDEPILFNGRYKIFEIEDDIWENRPFSTLEEMERVIILLSRNLIELKEELEQEKKYFEEFWIDSEKNCNKKPSFAQSRKDL